MRLPQLKLTGQNLNKNILAVFILTGLLVSALVMMTVRPAFGSRLFAGEAPAAFTPSTALQDELQIQLGENGFTPSEVQHAAGTFAIAVENSTLSGDYTLQLKAHDGTLMKEVQVQKGSTAWTVTLSAGEYSLTESSHQWLCRITVQ